MDSDSTGEVRELKGFSSGDGICWRETGWICVSLDGFVSGKLFCIGIWGGFAGEITTGVIRFLTGFWEEGAPFSFEMVFVFVFY